MKWRGKERQVRYKSWVLNQRTTVGGLRRLEEKREEKFRKRKHFTPPRGWPNVSRAILEGSSGVPTAQQTFHYNFLLGVRQHVFFSGYAAKGLSSFEHVLESREIQWNRTLPTPICKLGPFIHTLTLLKALHNTKSPLELTE